MPVSASVRRAVALAALGLTTLMGFVAAGCRDSSSAPKPSVVATPVDPATAGTVRLEVRYSGPVPTPKVLDMSVAAQCAAIHTQPVYDQSFVVRDGRLVNAVVWIKQGLEHWVFAPPSTPVRIDQKGCIFEPHVVAAMVNQPIEFTNSDPEPHNVHGKPRVVSAFNFMLSRAGAKRMLAFDKPEVAIPVGCDIHPWMRAYVAVVSNPYVAVTASEGFVTLSNVPPGEYVIGVWHEKLGTKEQVVKLEPRGSAALQVTY